jgi:endonuclease/exonuclease/phosphatase family metal-dependent hydrolase
MRILSWNILASEWIKGAYYPKIDKKILFDREARLKRILTVLTESNADIILLQEVMPLEYKTLKRHLQKKYITAPLIAIQWKYSPKESASESGNTTFLRRTLYAKANLHFSALDFGLVTELPKMAIINVHLDDLSGQTRNKQIEEIKELLYKKPKCILAGDFNQIYRKNSKLYSLPDFTVHNIECPTYYIEEKMNIDNILTRGFATFSLNNKAHKCMIYPLTMNEGIEMYGSDHLPVVIDI